MNFKNKLGNFWYYYKYHTIVVIIILLIIPYLYFSGKDDKMADFNFVLFTVNNPFDNSNIKQDLDDLIVIDKNKKEVKIAFLPFDVNDQSSQNSMMSLQALTVWISAQDVDILIADEEVIKRYSVDDEGKNTNAFVPLSDHKLDLVKTLQDSDKNKIAILVSDLPKLKNLEFFEKNLYMSVVSTGKNKDKAQKIINYFLD